MYYLYSELLAVRQQYEWNDDYACETINRKATRFDGELGKRIRVFIEGYFFLHRPVIINCSWKTEFVFSHSRSCSWRCLSAKNMRQRTIASFKWCNSFPFSDYPFSVYKRLKRGSWCERGQGKTDFKSGVVLSEAQFVFNVGFTFKSDCVLCQSRLWLEVEFGKNSSHLLNLYLLIICAYEHAIVYNISRTIPSKFVSLFHCRTPLQRFVGDGFFASVSL